jgi:hypothetical protein
MQFGMPAILRDPLSRSPSSALSNVPSLQVRRDSKEISKYRGPKTSRCTGAKPDSDCMSVCYRVEFACRALERYERQDFSSFI